MFEIILGVDRLLAGVVTERVDVAALVGLPGTEQVGEPLPETSHGVDGSWGSPSVGIG